MSSGKAWRTSCTVSANQPSPTGRKCGLSFKKSICQLTMKKCSLRSSSFCGRDPRRWKITPTNSTSSAYEVTCPRLSGRLSPGIGPDSRKISARTSSRLGRQRGRSLLVGFAVGATVSGKPCAEECAVPGREHPERELYGGQSGFTCWRGPCSTTTNT